MIFEDFVSIIYENLKGRFEIDDANDYSKSLESLASPDLVEKELLRIYRSHTTVAGNRSRKTLLIVRVSDPKELENALVWAAATRDMLLDPETADLYLFLCWGNHNEQSLEECLRIESTEEFCRKYVIRPSETGQSFVERTFLSRIDHTLQKRLGADPLIKIFTEIESEYSWFDHKEQKKWRDAFNSELTGSDLIEALFAIKNDLK